MGWLSGGYQYRKSITLSRASGAVTNYQMKLLLGESSGATGEDVDCGGKCQSDFDDIRFTKSDGTTLLDYWIESVSGATPNKLATIWIEFDSIGTGATTFYLYYGNSNAGTRSNVDATFPFFDDNEHKGYTTTKLADSQGSPEGFVLINGYFYQAEQKDPTRIHEINPATGAATGGYFDFNSADSVHMSALLWDGAYLWGGDHIRNKVFKIDLAASLSSHAAVILGSFTVTFFGAAAFVMFNGTVQMMITEWASAATFVVVDYISALAAGTSTGHILRTFYGCADGSKPGRVQGFYSSSNDSYTDFFASCQLYTGGGSGQLISYMRWFTFGDLYFIPNGTTIIAASYYKNDRYGVTAFTGQQPALYSGVFYIPAEEPDLDILYLTEAQQSEQKEGWDLDTGSLFTLSTDNAFTGSYSAKLPSTANSSMNFNIVLGTGRLDIKIYPMSTDEHIYIGAAEAADLSDRLGVGVHGSAYWEYWDGSWHTTAVAISTSAWATISFVTDGAGNLKLLINDTEVYAGTRFDVLNYVIYEPHTGYGSDSVYIDSVLARKYYATEPAWGSWGLEEIPAPDKMISLSVMDEATWMDIIADEMVSLSEMDEATWESVGNYKTFLIF
jgi:hypothetical protein